MNLHIEQRRNISIMADAYVTPPLKVLALPHGTDARLRLMQMSASPGLLDGDTQKIELSLAKNAHLQLQTQAYQRVFATHSHALQSTTIKLAPHSSLIYVPHPIVLHESSHLKLNNHIYLADNVRMIWSEIIASGRKHRLESFAFKQCSSLTKFHHRDELILRDNLQWRPANQNLNSPVHMSGYSHQATLYLADTHVDFDAKGTLNVIYDFIKPCLFDIYFGLSQTHRHLLTVRILAHDGETLYDLLKSVASHLQKINDSKPSCC